jgi:hypothetical protein
VTQDGGTVQGKGGSAKEARPKKRRTIIVEGEDGEEIEEEVEEEEDEEEEGEGEVCYSFFFGLPALHCIYL